MRRRRAERRRKCSKYWARGQVSQWDADASPMATETRRAPLRLVDGPEGSQVASALLDAGLDVAYQPIVHLGSGSVLAYEALARPRHPDARNPQVFFQLLEDAGARLAGERAAFEAALRGTADHFPRVKLFLNASPTTLVDPEFDIVEFFQLGERYGLSPSDLVVEVTESEAVHDLATLASRCERLGRLGVGLAVDDAGAGHASFRVITRLRPSYIKLDRDLVSNVDGDGARHAFIEAMVRFSRQIGSRLIAEGIETEAELASLAGLGVEAGQGYFIARPESGFASPSPAARRMIATAAQRPLLGAAQVTAGELVRPALEIGQHVTVAEAYARFLADPAAGMLVITEGNRVVAQLTRRAVERFLASPGSWERLADRPAVEFAERHPMTVSTGLDIVEVGAMLAARPRHQVADDLTVTDTLGHLVGVLPLREVIRTLTDLRRRGEQDLNPLSGLLGPAWLEGELGRRLDAGETLTGLLVDVDRFRRLNDLGGFALGDDVIRVLSVCLTGVAGGVPGADVAHVGGDDFMLVLPPQHFEDVIAELIRGFETEVMPFLRLELRLRQGAHLMDEIGLSIAAVDLQGTPAPGLRYLEWAQDGLAPLMALAKQHDGHSCVRGSGEMVSVTTWTAAAPGQRKISIGQAEPGVVLAMVDLVEQMWGEWVTGSGARQYGLHRFPGPVDELERFRVSWLEPLRERAEAALAARAAGIAVNLEGDEEEVLALLDRLALASREAYARQPLPLPPHFSLLDRMIRQRSRVVRREDRLSRSAHGVHVADPREAPGTRR